MLRGGYHILDFSGIEINGYTQDYTHPTNMYQVINTQKKPILISGLTIIDSNRKLRFPDFFVSFVPEEGDSYGATIYGSAYLLTIIVNPDNTASFHYTSF